MVMTPGERNLSMPSFYPDFESVKQSRQGIMNRLGYGFVLTLSYRIYRVIRRLQPMRMSGCPTRAVA